MNERRLIGLDWTGTMKNEETLLSSAVSDVTVPYRASGSIDTPTKLLKLERHFCSLVRPTINIFCKDCGNWAGMW